jgi:hypothetical protein
MTCTIYETSQSKIHKHFILNFKYHVSNALGWSV